MWAAHTRGLIFLILLNLFGRGELCVGGVRVAVSLTKGFGWEGGCVGVSRCDPVNHKGTPQLHKHVLWWIHGREIQKGLGGWGKAGETP